MNPSRRQFTQKLLALSCMTAFSGATGGLLLFTPRPALAVTDPATAIAIAQTSLQLIGMFTNSHDGGYELGKINLELTREVLRQISDINVALAKISGDLLRIEEAIKKEIVINTLKEYKDTINGCLQRYDEIIESGNTKTLSNYAKEKLKQAHDDLVETRAKVTTLTDIHHPLILNIAALCLKPEIRMASDLYAEQEDLLGILRSYKLFFDMALNVNHSTSLSNYYKNSTNKKLQSEQKLNTLTSWKAGYAALNRETAYYYTDVYIEPAITSIERRAHC